MLSSLPVVSTQVLIQDGSHKTLMGHSHPTNVADKSATRPPVTVNTGKIWHVNPSGCPSYPWSYRGELDYLSVSVILVMTSNKRFRKGVGQKIRQQSTTDRHYLPQRDGVKIQTLKICFDFKLKLKVPNIKLRESVTYLINLVSR